MGSKTKWLEHQKLDRGGLVFVIGRNNGIKPNEAAAMVFAYPAEGRVSILWFGVGDDSDKPDIEAGKHLLGMLAFNGDLEICDWDVECTFYSNRPTCDQLAEQINKANAA